MRTLLFATVAAVALGVAIPASAQVVYADPGPGVGVQVGPFGFGVGPRYGWRGYAYDRRGYAYDRYDCPLVREESSPRAGV